MKTYIAKATRCLLFSTPVEKELPSFVAEALLFGYLEQAVNVSALTGCKK